MSEAWSQEEVEAAVADYFDMLGMELRGESYNKAEYNRHLQRLLREVVEQRLSGATALHQTVARVVESQVDAVPDFGDILSIQVSPPSRERSEGRLYERAETPRNPVRRNYLELEARNQSLGRAGEEMVLKFEHTRLWRAGQRTLADRLEHVSRTQGDHLGYDIHSFETDGRDRLIEVKTTRFGAMTPFFASRNEVVVSESRERDYQLYRLFGFRQQPKLFVLAGSLRHTCELEPVSFLAKPN